MTNLQIASRLICLLFFALTVIATTHSAQAGSAAPSITLTDSVHSSERIYNLPGLSNVGRVAPGVLRGAQPGKDGPPQDHGGQDRDRHAHHRQ